MSSCKRRAAAGALRLCAALAALLLAAACGDLPQPYRGRPGGNSAVLAVPMAIRLAISPPGDALLDSKGAQDLADSLANALLKAEVPAIATDHPLPLDWKVDITAERQGSSIRPRYRLVDADGKVQAVTEGDRVPAREWQNPSRELMQQVAEVAAPKITQQILRIEAGRKASDPLALTAGPPRIHMAGVRGAPGDGNAALAAQMAKFLGTQGFTVQDSAEGAIFALHAEVTVGPAARGNERVEIIWIVSRRDGQELGRVAQINELPAGRLSRPWGDIAYAASEEAADGVRTVVSNAIAPREGEAPTVAAQAIATPQPAAQPWAGPRSPR